MIDSSYAYFRIMFFCKILQMALDYKNKIFIKMEAHIQIMSASYFIINFYVFTITNLYFFYFILSLLYEDSPLIL